MAAGGNTDDGGSRDALHRERCAADAELVASLAAAGFAGPEYEAFRRRLAGIGFVVVMGQLGTGEIFRTCAAMRRPIYPRSDELKVLAASPDDRAAIAGDAAMRGLEMFCERAVRGGGWSPDGGATLRTFFVGACVRRFPEAFRAWRRERDRDGWCDTYGVDPTDVVDRAVPAWTPSAFVELVEELAGMPSWMRHVAVEMVFSGRTLTEIADDLDTTPAALTERVRRYRARRRTTEGDVR